MTAKPVSGTSIAILATKASEPQLYYQTLDGQLTQSALVGNTWTQTPLGLFPVSLSPFAVVNLSVAQETRVFYLDTTYTLREWVLSPGQDWHEGDLGGKLKIRAIPNSRLAAVSYTKDGKDQVHVFYEDYNDLHIREAIHTGSWAKGSIDLAGVLTGSGIAATARIDEQKRREVTVFYQADNFVLRSQVFVNGWAAGNFNPKSAAGVTPISAAVFDKEEIQVYWRDLPGKLVFSARKAGDVWDTPGVVAGVTPSYEIAVVGWGKTTSIGLYLQDSTSSIYHLGTTNSGSTWSQPAVVVPGST